MEHLTIPLSEQEETIIQLLKKVYELEYENFFLKEEIRRLKWTLEEQD